MKNKTLKFRNFNSRDREGFVFVFKQLPNELVLEDILFQLFIGIYPKIISPEIYYFTEAEQIIKYSEILNFDNFIYVHFVERETNIDPSNMYKKPFILFNLQKLARGLKKSNDNLLHIFSQKQYIAYNNKKYCQIVKERINDLTRTTLQRRVSNVSFIQSIKNLLQEKDVREEITNKLSQQSKRLIEKQYLISELTKSLTKIKNQTEMSLKLVNIHLEPIFDVDTG